MEDKQENFEEIEWEEKLKNILFNLYHQLTFKRSATVSPFKVSRPVSNFLN
jgi:hypothetical protein